MASSSADADNSGMCRDYIWNKGPRRERYGHRHKLRKLRYTWLTSSRNCDIAETGVSGESLIVYGFGNGSWCKEFARLQRDECL